MSRLSQVRKVLIYTLFLNLSVATAKIIYGYSMDSISMRSDGFHSFFDGTSNVIGLIGIWVASQPPDPGHPYGHRKFESLSTIAIAVMIFATGTEILREAYQRLSVPYDIKVSVMSFVVMAVTLAVNIGVMMYETRKGRELKSDFLTADAMHTRSDIYISLSVVISLIAAKAGYPAVDIIAAFIITLFIAKMGFSILKSATDVLADAACINPDDISKVVMNIHGVRECHGIRTRGNRDFVNVDLHVLVDPEEKIQDAHTIAHKVEDAIKKGFSSVVDVVIHVEPYKKQSD
jgi:cation diffusion facilitator family transporter